MEEGLSHDGDAEEEPGKVSCEECEEEASEEEEEEEVRKSAGRKSPKMPTMAEQAEHARMHCPYRNWCRCCVKARARNAPHSKNREEDSLSEVKVPRVAMGYFFVQRRRENIRKPVICNAGRKARRALCKSSGPEGTWKRSRN